MTAPDPITLEADPDEVTTTVPAVRMDAHCRRDAWGASIERMRDERTFLARLAKENARENADGVSLDLVGPDSWANHGFAYALMCVLSAVGVALVLWMVWA